MKRLLVSLTACMAMMFSSTHAAEVTCSGRVVQINLHSPNTFMLQLDSMNYPVFFCRSNENWAPDGTVQTTSAETCRMLVAMFLTAKAQDKRLRAMYFDGAQVPGTCNTWAPWSSANIRYFEWEE